MGKGKNANNRDSVDYLAKMIIGRKILAAQNIHDYTQLRFDDQSVLSIYNKFSLTGAVTTLDRTVGQVVTGLDASAEMLKLLLWPTGTLAIGLCEEDYSGPEALSYAPSSGPTIVVN